MQENLVLDENGCKILLHFLVGLQCLIVAPETKYFHKVGFFPQLLTLNSALCFEKTVFIGSK